MPPEFFNPTFNWKRLLVIIAVAILVVIFTWFLIVQLFFTSASKPYTFLVWLYHMATLAVMFLPFYVITLTQKQVRWWHLVGAMVLSFLVYFFVFLIGTGEVWGTDWRGVDAIIDNYIKDIDLTAVFEDLFVAKIILFYPLLLSLRFILYGLFIKSTIGGAF